MENVGVALSFKAEDNFFCKIIRVTYSEDETVCRGGLKQRKCLNKNRRLCVRLCWRTYLWLILFYPTLFLLVLIFKHSQEYNTNLDTRFIGC